MTKYRPTTADVDAVQITAIDPPTFKEQPNWLTRALEVGDVGPFAPDGLKVQASRGVVLAHVSDWITFRARGNTFELGVLTQGVLDADYTPAPEDDSPSVSGAATTGTEATA